VCRTFIARIDASKTDGLHVKLTLYMPDKETPVTVV
jgi:hypothetical protein